MTIRVVVINPNSSQYMTDAMSRCVEPLRSAQVTIDCLTLSEGPPGIVTYLHEAIVVEPLQKMLARERAHTDVFVVACFGDPGLLALRETVDVPVLGIGETSMCVAMSLGDRFGILSTDEEAIRQHERQIRAYGFGHRFAGDVSIDIPILELERDRVLTIERLSVAAKALKDRGAETIVTGCGGLADFREALQSTAGIRVIEPVLATTAQAVGLARLSSSAQLSRSGGRWSPGKLTQSP